MTEWNIAKRSPEEQEKTATDLQTAGVAYRLRMKQPVIPEHEMRRQPEHLRTYFMERVNHHLDCGRELLAPDDPRYADMAEEQEAEGMVLTPELLSTFSPYRTHHINRFGLS